ncbi:hypothetical protein [Actinomycetospora corticicola]|uniref:Uncharacterized protein n=1 Tax=Actinomycetospora corticicola TaxID=663602 RepID=A0A7Y9J5H6_9PSEU|nr:hypothetical protein [Actinomycetospora corticicola]NYD36143.1 hypothetical protein [Actinomycetospora corticicola]
MRSTRGTALSVDAVEVLFNGNAVNAKMLSLGSYEAAWSAPAGTLTVQARTLVDGLEFNSPPVEYVVLLSPAPASTAPVDVLPPVFVELSPIDGTTIKLDSNTSTASVTFSGKVADPDSSATAPVTVSVQAPGVIEASATSTDQTFSVAIELPGPGLYPVRVTATDHVGNAATTVVQVVVLEKTVVAVHELVVVEYMRLSNYLGSYGAGRTIQTFSLLPGEKTTITIKSFRSTTQERSATSSLLEGDTGTTRKDLEDAVAREQTTKSTEDESFKAAASVEAAGNWGVASAKVSGSVAYGTNAARESMGKSVVSAIAKNTSEVSSKRDSRVENVSKEATTGTDEQTTLRVLENTNMSRTLNFVFRQMNQEFISLLHLVDVKIGLLTTFLTEDQRPLTKQNGEVVSRYREYTLPELDSLLSEVVKPDRQADVRARVLAQLDTVVDWRGQRRDVVAWKSLTRPKRDSSGKPVANETVVDGPYPVFEAAARPSDGDENPALPAGKDTYADETGNSIEVSGVILQAQKISLRSDGIMLDAVLGGGNALDPYSSGLQQTAIAAKRLANNLADEEVKRLALGRSIVEGLSGQAAADAFRALFVPDPPPARSDA